MTFVEAPKINNTQDTALQRDWGYTNKMLRMYFNKLTGIQGESTTSGFGANLHCQMVSKLYHVPINFNTFKSQAS